MNSIVQSEDPSAVPSAQGVPQPVHEAVLSGALMRRPEAWAVTVADSDPAVAVTVTWLGVSPVVILGLVSICGAGMVTESRPR